MRTLAGFVAASLALGAPQMAQAKRRAPAEIKPVVAAGIRYVVPHFGALHAKEQNGGYVQAWDVRTDTLQWDRLVYRVVREATLEPDVQDVFIVRISVKDGTLLVDNELGETFAMDLGTGTVKALVKKPGRTELAPQEGGP